MRNRANYIWLFYEEIASAAVYTTRYRMENVENVLGNATHRYSIMKLVSLYCCCGCFAMQFQIRTNNTAHGNGYCHCYGSLWCLCRL